MFTLNTQKEQPSDERVDLVFNPPAMGLREGRTGRCPGAAGQPPLTTQGQGLCSALVVPYTGTCGLAAATQIMAKEGGPW